MSDLQTLSDVLRPAKTSSGRLRRVLSRGALIVIATLIGWSVLIWPALDLRLLGAIAALIIIRAVALLTAPRGTAHFLLTGDDAGFMAALRLDQKTTVLDGSNLYHFGVDNDLSGHVIGRTTAQLRREGYRVVCFFDANIFYRLMEFGDFDGHKRHDRAVLLRLFDLNTDEVYVVPSGEQADRYILSTLKHLPMSFAISNDRFRDYGQQYASVMKGDQWRKGVRIDGNELKLNGFRFATPVRSGSRHLCALMICQSAVLECDDHSQNRFVAPLYSVMEISHLRMWSPILNPPVKT